MTIRSAKKFDCVAMKDAAQREIVARIEGLALDQEIARIRRDVEEGPLGDWWRSLPKDLGPQPTALPVETVPGARSADGGSTRRAG